jgi:hypothetical protein
MTPYEIRLSLLQMAKDLLTDDYHTQRNSLEQEWATKVDAAKIAGTESPSFPKLPVFPSENEIVKKAEALNLFVSQTPAQPEVKSSRKS